MRHYFRFLLSICTMEHAIRTFCAAAHVRAVNVGNTTLEKALAEASSLATRASSRIVYIGEVHENNDVTKIQIAALDSLIRTQPAALHMCFEHFVHEERASMQRAFLDSKHGQTLQGETAEGFTHIMTVLQYLRDHGRGVPIRLYTGFPSRQQARRFIGPQAGEAYAEAVQAGWLPPCQQGFLQGSDGHFAFFDALLNGKEETDGASWAPSPDSPARRIFPAQTVKDLSLAHAVATAYRQLPGGAEDEDEDWDEEGDEDNEEEGDGSASGAGAGAPTCPRRRGTVVALAGCGHVDFGFGVPERVAALLGITSHVPGAPPVKDQPPQLIITVRPKEVEGLPLPAIHFPDGTTRRAGDIVCGYSADAHKDEDEEGAAEARDGHGR